MNFRVIQQKTPSGAHSPYQVIEQPSGRRVGWINRFLDREYVRRLANTSLYSYAHSLLHFVRWWESVHHTGDIFKADLADSTLLDYLRFQSSRQPPPSAATINDRVACADRAIRNEFPDATYQAAPGFQQIYLHRRPLGIGRPRFELSRLRVREPKLTIVPLSVDEVARFWSSFHTARDLAIVGLMLMHGLRSAEVLALESGGRVAFRSAAPRAWQGQQAALPALAPETAQLLDHYLRLERPRSLLRRTLRLAKGPARGTRMTPAGLRSLFRYHRRRTGIQARQPAPLPAHLRLGYGARRDQPARADAVDGSRRHPNDSALCADHPARRLPAVCPCRGAASPSPAEALLMKRARHPPLLHPLAAVFDRAVDSLCAALSPESHRHYRGTVRNFLRYLGAAHPEVNSLEQLRRDPHLLGWMSRLRSHMPPLATSSYINRLIALRALLQRTGMDRASFLNWPA